MSFSPRKARRAFIISATSVLGWWSSSSNSRSACFRPMPRVLEGGDLRLALLALGRFEEEVVVALGVERRVEVDQVHGFVRELRRVPQHLQIVAIVKPVHGREVYAGQASPQARNLGRCCR